jgi:hypothetical protein
MDSWVGRPHRHLLAALPRDTVASPSVSSASFVRQCDGLTAYGFHPTMLETHTGRAKLEC